MSWGGAKRPRFWKSESLKLAIWVQLKPETPVITGWRSKQRQTRHRTTANNQCACHGRPLHSISLKQWLKLLFLLLLFCFTSYTTHTLSMSTFSIGQCSLSKVLSREWFLHFCMVHVTYHIQSLFCLSPRKHTYCFPWQKENLLFFHQMSQLKTLNLSGFDMECVGGSFSGQTQNVLAQVELVKWFVVGLENLISTKPHGCII